MLTVPVKSCVEKQLMFLAYYALLWNNKVCHWNVFTVLARTSLYRISKAPVHSFNGYMTTEST